MVRLDRRRHGTAIRALGFRHLRRGLDAHDFGIEGWPSDKAEKLEKLEVREGGYRHQHLVYLWRIGSK